MAEEINAYCDICGRGYHLCMSCSETKNLTPWKIYTDTSEHYKIYQILHGYTCGIYTKEEAKKKLKSVDLSDLEEFRDKTKNYIKGILEEEPIKNKVNKEDKNLSKK